MPALPALLATLLVVAVAGCGEDEPRRFQEAGFALTFEYPAGFEASDDVSLNRQGGSQAEESRAVALDQDNGIIVQRFGLKQSIGREQLDLAKAEFDRLVQSLAPGAPKGRKTTVGDFPALSYENVPVPDPEGAESRIVVLFDGRTEYLLNCQSTPDSRSEVEEACDLAVRTVKRTG